MSQSNPISRRRFLALTGGTVAATAALWGVSSAPVWARPRFSAEPFALGIASGDPRPDGVVLWTRLAPDPLAADGHGGMPAKRVAVRWQVAEDARFHRVVRSGTEHAVPELAHTVHAEVGHLRPGRDYYYRFLAGDEVSPVGHTRTAPAQGRRLDELSLALVSCQKWAGGRYAAYRTMAEEDLDLVLHVGDYIYEEPTSETLTDFRLLHALHKTSPDLQAAHARFPFVVTLDDHEVENDWGAGVSRPDDEPSNEPERFLALRAAAFQAYWEHLPLRRAQRPSGPDMLLHRRFSYGDLTAFQVLDTRQYRTPNLSYEFPFGPLQEEASDPERSLPGAEQERWMFDGLRRSDTRWNVLAQQTVMAHYDYDLTDAVAVNHDQWDGYSASRDRLLGYIDRVRPDNPVVLTGDWHCAFVNDLKAVFADPASETLATEFVGTSVSSDCRWAGDVANALPENPHVKWADGTRRGWLRCTVTRDEWRSDYRVVAAADDAEGPAQTQTSWVVESGHAGAQPA